ncbi:MAG: right-handed parallel beta-helix repeat-containing protein [Acidimicrobiales bacterium]
MTAAIAVPGMLAFSQPSSASTTFTVNDTTDAALSNPAGTSCSSTNGGSCTLRAAIQAADNSGGSSTITLPSGVFKLTIPSTGADDPSTGDLDVKAGITITISGQGAGATIIDATHIDRAFAVQSGASLSISGVTIENGSQNDATPSDHSTAPAYGGAFYNDGVLSVSNCVLTNNSAYYGGGVVFADTGASATSITNSTVTGSSSGGGYGGVLYVESGAITLSADTITGNSSYYYGAVLYDYESGHTVGAVTINQSTISNNAAYYDYGGALYLDDAGALTITGSTFENNILDYYYGGAVYDETSGELTVSGSTFNGNASGGYYGYGGAIETDGTDLSVSGSTFEGNIANYGGAIYIEGSSATAVESITTSTFSDNKGSGYYYYGGAIYDDYGDLQISDSTFDGNAAAYGGGALFYESADGLYLVNDTFDGNVANSGGAIYLDEAATTGSINLLNDTITRNTAYYGGGIAYPEYANSIENTIVAGNSGGATTDGGGDCYGSGATANAGSADKGGNIDSDGTCFSSIISRDQTGVNPDLGSLSNNGGPTATDAELPGSPAIGTAQAGFCPLTDQRGVARPSTSCDVGAYQSASAGLVIAGSGPKKARVGNPVSEKFLLTNQGSGPAIGVMLSDNLPANTDLFSWSTSQGSCTGGKTVTCSLGTINSSATGSPTTASVTIVLVPTKAASLTDWATVSAADSATVSASAKTLVSASVAGTAPVVLTTSASKVSSTSARLSGIVNPAGESTTYSFDLGTSKSYGKIVRGGKLKSALSPISVSVSVAALKPDTTYYFRVVANNATGTRHGQDMTFKTSKAKSKH